MTTLGTIRANHLSLTCRSCGHNALLEVAVLLERLPPDTKVQQVLQKARCSHCKVKSNSDCQIIFVGGSLEALKGGKASVTTKRTVKYHEKETDDCNFSLCGS